NEPIGRLDGHTAAVSAVACATVEGRPVAITGSRDETIRLWDLASNEPIGRLDGHTAAVSAVACATVEGRPVAITGSHDETIRLWDLKAETGLNARTDDQHGGRT
ncbi:WD40 repeat domain-containing protein, partial [Streptomyces sp. NPDC094038]|uniref:WD40 repeat domain-containing protein n=1 Tax=Streptomyces sp. NPDC094038 TaxID=3366055 RepID=UPI00381B32C8